MGKGEFNGLIRDCIWFCSRKVYTLTSIRRKDIGMKRLLSCLLAAVMLCTIIAAPANATTMKNFTVSDVVRFLEVSDNGFLVLNEEMAVAEGVPYELISRVKLRIEYMNSLVRDHGAYIDDSFSAIILLPSSRANGVNKVVTYIHGLTEVYMDSDVADGVLEYLSGLGGVAKAGGVISYLMGLSKFKNAASALGTLSSTIGYVVDIYTWQIETAAASGRGIVMSVLDDGTTATLIVGYSSQ